VDRHEQGLLAAGGRQAATARNGRRTRTEAVAQEEAEAADLLAELEAEDAKDVAEEQQDIEMDEAEDAAEEAQLQAFLTVPPPPPEESPDAADDTNGLQEDLFPVQG